VLHALLQCPAATAAVAAVGGNCCCLWSVHIEYNVLCWLDVLQRYVKCPLELQALQLEIVISEETERETQRQVLKVSSCAGGNCILHAGESCRHASTHARSSIIWADIPCLVKCLELQSQFLAAPMKQAIATKCISSS